MRKSAKETNSVKEVFLKKLKANLGNATRTCNELAVGKATFYNWMNTDEAFKSQVNDIREMILDIAEDALYQKIKDGNITAIIFTLKTLGKKRGYIEKQEIEVKGDEFDINIK